MIAEVEQDAPEATQTSGNNSRTRQELMTELRTLIPAIGIREAARQLGMSEDTAKTWALRYGMTTHPVVKNVLSAIPRGPQMSLNPVNPNAPNGGAIMANSIAGKVLRTRINHAETALEISEDMRKVPTKDWLTPDGVTVLLGTAKHAALTAGWNADSRPDSPGKAFGGRNSGLEIDVETLECEQIETITEAASTDVNDY